MAITLAVGTSVAIASAYGAAKTLSAFSNASAAVATLEASHGVTTNDFVEVTSGWARANGRILKATGVSTNDVTFAGFDTSSTTFYPAGTGTGSVREVSTWTTISQITRAISIAGGEQQFADITSLEDAITKQIPTRRSAVSVTLPVYFDPDLSWVATVRAAAETATATAVKFTYPDGTVIVGNGYWSLQEIPTIEDETLRSRIDITFAAVPMVY